MSEKPKNRGVTVLVLEINGIGSVVFLEGLLMQGEIGFLATSNKISYVGDTR